MPDRESWTERDGAGPVEGGRPAPSPKSENVVWQPTLVDRAERERRRGHRGVVLWFTGLSAAGKSTLARQVEKRLFEEGYFTYVLDGDNVRHGLNGDLGFTAEDRAENIRRVGEVARLFFEQGSIAVCTFVSPYRRDRDNVRRLVPDGRFFEIHVDCDVETCVKRDPKGLYKKAIEGEIPNFTGISAPYEAPEEAELVLQTDEKNVEESVDELVALLEEKGIL